MRLTLFTFGLLCTVKGGGESTKLPIWSVTQNGQTCILMKAQIDLTLSYYEDIQEAEKDVTITIPSTVYSSENDGSCSTQVFFKDGSAQKGQIMQLTFGDDEKWNGWNARFAFTSVSAIGFDKKEYVLIQVNVTANYSSRPDLFKIPDGGVSTHEYVQIIDSKSPPNLVDTIYASNGYSLYCPSKQKFAINTDLKNGPRAYIQFSRLQVQAFKSTPGETFDHRETCPTDQHMTDKVPIVVGGVLAGLIVLTLAVYLFYRSRLPPEVLHMVNAHSSYENKAMAQDEEKEFYD